MNHKRHVIPTKPSHASCAQGGRLPTVQRRTCGQLYIAALWLQKEWRVGVINEVHGSKTVGKEVCKLVGAAFEGKGHSLLQGQVS